MIAAVDDKAVVLEESIRKHANESKAQGETIRKIVAEIDGLTRTSEKQNENIKTQAEKIDSLVGEIQVQDRKIGELSVDLETKIEYLIRPTGN